MDRNLVLVGFMGTGKTEVGKIIAERLIRTFVDVDDRIVSLAGMTINEIFKTRGESFFRDLESDVIEEVSGRMGLVISTGGGSLLRDQNVRNLKRTGLLVWLTASPEEIIRRVSDERHRPLLNVPDRIAAVREMMEKRTPYYRVSDITINTEGKNIVAAAEEICEQYERITTLWSG